MKKAFRFTILPIVLLGIFNFQFSACSSNQQNYNVLFIAVDDLRPTMGCYGDSVAITPNMDQLAAAGIVFNRAYCQQAVCNPSRASIMTGLRPNQIGVVNLESHFREKMPDVVTLPQIFTKNGYEAVAIGKIFHGSKNAQDEISWSKPSLFNLSIKKNEYALPENKTGKKATAVEIADLNDEEYEDGQIARDAIHQLQEFKTSGKHFFMAVGFKKPHLPFCAPKKYWDLYNSSRFDSIPDREKPVNAPEIAFHNSQELRGYTDIPAIGSIDQDQEKILWNGYYACVSFVDAQLGKIMEKLAELGLDKNTIIVLWGDHGYHLGEQELWCKSTNFELDNRIPLILSAPNKNFKKGVKSESIVEAVDIYPTIIDLCGLKAEGTLAGKSLKLIMENPSDKVKDFAFSQFIRPYGAIQGKPYSHMGYTVRNKDWRCTIWCNSQNDSIEYKELYDLKKITIEKKNISGEEKFKGIESQLTKSLLDYKNGKF